MTQANAPTARSDDQRESAPRARAANFGGPRMKLSVGKEIPGFHLYWENDEGGAIEQLLYEGFEFVTQSEVTLTSHVVIDSDVTDRVSRYVGRKEDGSPLRAFLLKCPDELWAEREANRAHQADAWDEDIRQSVTRPAAGNYNPKGVTNTLDTKFRKEY